MTLLLLFLNRIILEPENLTRPNLNYKDWVGLDWFSGLGWVSFFEPDPVRVSKEVDGVNPTQPENIKKKLKLKFEWNAPTISNLKQDFQINWKSGVQYFLLFPSLRRSQYGQLLVSLRELLNFKKKKKKN